MIKVLIAKSAKEAESAKVHMEPDIVLCPEKVDFGAWYPTWMFCEKLFKPCGEWIPEAHAKKTKHVARIQTMALGIASSHGDGNIALLFADVTPPAGWLQRLEESLVDGVGMAAGIIPNGYDDGVKAWYVDGRPAKMGDDFGIATLVVECASLDCCVMTKDAAQKMIPFSGELLTETEIGVKLKEAGIKVALHPFVLCLHA